nr:serine/threonine-protein phosphatase 2A 55 kDa regulatory subunit B delta isoform isoform X2 [Camelus dromedarius]
MAGEEQRSGGGAGLTRPGCPREPEAAAAPRAQRLAVVLLAGQGGRRRGRGRSAIVTGSYNSFFRMFKRNMQRGVPLEASRENSKPRASLKPRSVSPWKAEEGQGQRVQPGLHEEGPVHGLAPGGECRCGCHQ